MDAQRTDRGQSGLDRLLVFVIAVVVLLVVTPHVLGFLGVDVGSTSTGAPAGDGNHDLVILEARGTAIDEGAGTVGAVRLVVTPAANRAPVDLTEGMAIWVADRSYYLEPDGGETDLEGSFRASVIDGPGQTLETRDARGELVFDLGGSDDVADGPEFGSALQAGETVSVTLVTPAGETLTRDLRVPESVSGNSVPL